VHIYSRGIIVGWRVFCLSYLLSRLWVIVIFLGASYWQNYPRVLFDRDQTLRGLIHEPELNLSILTEAYIHMCVRYISH